MVAGCIQLGPNFEPPGEPWIDTWNSPALDQATRSSEQPDLRQWWSVFNDPVLDQLIADADANNTDIKIAGLRVIEARAQLGIAQSGRYPQSQQIRAETLYIDRSESGGRNPLDDNLWQYSAGFDVGWELDFWGRFSRAIESADAAISPPAPTTKTCSCCCMRRCQSLYGAADDGSAPAHRP